MFGSDRTNGLLKRSVEYILQIEHMIVSCVELAENDFHDLVDNRKRIAKIDDGEKKRISSTAEFDILISKVLKLKTLHRLAPTCSSISKMIAERNCHLLT